MLSRTRAPAVTNSSRSSPVVATTRIQDAIYTHALIYIFKHILCIHLHGAFEEDCLVCLAYDLKYALNWYIFVRKLDFRLGVYIDFDPHIYLPLQDAFVCTVNKSFEKLKEQEQKEGWGWFTESQMKTELKWSKPGPQKS